MPPPDFAERLERQWADWLARNPERAERIALARTIALWVAIPCVIVAAIVLPGGGQGIVVTAGLLWLLLQVWLLCRSKSLSWATCARTLSLSALLAWPIGVIEIGVAGAIGWSPADQASSVLIAGPVEEALKLVPLVAFITLAANRARRMGVADHLLLGLAGGAGFQLMEDTIRRLVAAGTISTPFQQLIQSLVESPDADADYGPFVLIGGGSALDDAHFAGHGVLTALVAAGIGFAIRLRPRIGPRAWLIPAALWLLAVCDHVAYNYEATELSRRIGDDGGVVTLPGWFTDLHGLWGGGAEAVPLLLLLLAAAVVADYRSVRRVEDRLPALPGPDPSGIVAEAWVLLGAAARGPRVWFTAMPWLRQRRELAFDLDRGGGGRPDPAVLANRARWLRGALVGSAAVLALLAAGVALAALIGEPAFLAGLLDDLGAWWGDLSGIQQLAAVLGLAALLGLAGMGFLPALSLVSALSTIADHGQGLADLIRDPRKAIRDFVKDMTPGEALAYAVGLILERLLRGLSKRITDRFGPRRATDDPIPDPPPPLVIDSRQFGRKIGRHTAEFGMDPTSAADRAKMRGIIEDIAAHPDRVVDGTFSGQGPGGTRGPVTFRIKGDDVVITTRDGRFVTIMKDGIHNTSVREALKP